ncbi:MAG: WecB/TagA/CpsF family glycosyltransferase [Robiginitomaculum sp.]
MNTQQKLVSPVPRGSNRHEQERAPEEGNPEEGKNDLRLGMDTYEFCGANFDPLTLSQTLERCKWISARHGFRYIVTPNVDHLVRLNKEPELYKPLYQASWLSVCDSRILEPLGKLSGVPLKAVPGSDLTRQIIETLLELDEPINVIGADDDVIAKVKELYGLMHVHHYRPPMGLRHKPHEIHACAKFIAEHPARYTFICVGSPQQEMIAKEARDRGDCVGLGLCVGASLDFLAGKQNRAPKWMQSARIEWLYRLLSDPKRMWKRYLVSGPKIFLIWIKWRARKNSG